MNHRQAARAKHFRKKRLTAWRRKRSRERFFRRAIYMGKIMSVMVKGYNLVNQIRTARDAQQMPDHIAAQTITIHLDPPTAEQIVNRRKLIEALSMCAPEAKVQA